MNKTVVKVIRLSLAVLCMATIFYLSHQEADISTDQSRGLMHKILTESGTENFKAQNPSAFALVHGTVRKIAHIVEYILLGYLVYSAMDSWGKSGKPIFIYSFMICLLFAVSDEIHQTFIPGRSGQISDVFLDGAGVLLGMYFYNIEIKIKRKIGGRNGRNCFTHQR